MSRIFNLVSARGDTLCNFVELPPGFGFAEDGEKEETGDEDLRVIYRHYGQFQRALSPGTDSLMLLCSAATLYFVFVVDQSESELGILDLIQVSCATHRRSRFSLTFSTPQVFVESLDRCFENVCELDLIFHFDEVRAA